MKLWPFKCSGILLGTGRPTTVPQVGFTCCCSLAAVDGKLVCASQHYTWGTHICSVCVWKSAYLGCPRSQHIMKAMRRSNSSRLKAVFYHQSCLHCKHNSEGWITHWRRTKVPLEYLQKDMLPLSQASEVELYTHCITPHNKTSNHKTTMDVKLPIGQNSLV